MLNWQPIETFPKTDVYNGRLLVWITKGYGLLVWEGKPFAEFANWYQSPVSFRGTSLFIQDQDGDEVDVLATASHWAIVEGPK